ncbi:MAG TPA: hypothetical protein VF698_17240 [Thermoanaerobaculia bacterium]|jgi:hypothetical protein
MDEIRAYYDDEDTLRVHTYDDDSFRFDAREHSRADEELPFHIPRD